MSLTILFKISSADIVSSSLMRSLSPRLILLTILGANPHSLGAEADAVVPLVGDLNERLEYTSPRVGMYTL